MKINKKELTLVYTNIFFLIPFLIGLANGKLSLSILLGIFTLSSTTYHLFRKPGAEWWWRTRGRTKTQTFMLLSEIILALILSAWSIIIIYHKSLIILGLATVLFIPGFIMFLRTDYKKYILHHTIWHITSAAIITMALI